MLVIVSFAFAEWLRSQTCVFSSASRGEPLRIAIVSSSTGSTASATGAVSASSAARNIVGRRATGAVRQRGAQMETPEEENCPQCLRRWSLEHPWWLRI